MPRLAGFRSGFADFADLFMVDSIVLRRDGTDLAAQLGRVNRRPSGRLQQVGEGITGRSDAVPVAFKEDADVDVGDEFRFDGADFRLVFLSPPGSLASLPATHLLAWAVADRPE